MLLKTIEEPPATTVFIILADYVPPALVTIASRCVRCDFHPLPSPTYGPDSRPKASETAAAEAARAAGGRIDRARLLRRRS